MSYVKANLGRLQDGRELLLINNSVTPFAIVRNYDPTQREGNQWDNGEYISSLTTLATRIFEINMPVSYDRMAEIATRFIDNAKDNGEVENVIYDYDLNLDEEERDFFDIAV